MRATVVVLCLAAVSTATAQQPEAFQAPPEGSFSQAPTPSAPPDEPEWARTPPPPPSTGPAESPKERALRYSRFSAGPGGPAVAVTEVLLGLVGGSILGSAYDAQGETNNLYTGAMVGGLTLGTVGILYQYFFRVERSEALLSTLLSMSAMLGGVGFANDRDWKDAQRAALALACSQVGLFATLLLTSGMGLTGADMGLISLTSLYSVLIASLVEFINDAENSGRGYNFAPMLMAPVIGMALGGLLSIPLELNGVGFALISSVPLVASGMAIALAAPLSNNATTGRVVLITLTSSLGLTALITALTATVVPPQQTSTHTPRMTPVPVLLAAGRHNTGLAVGPGVSFQF
ncbi:hypothetical protein [Hyalangium versicolor]|uniref:hypothetical protein n=1 Tax=Hyalangium versicolor TaxID=2861190 RepID=UPI001CCB48CC|nr:hypothetical protein [Hyalangium versicolor]